MILTAHAEERIRRRRLPRQQVLQAFDQGEVMISWNGARIARWGRLRAVARGCTIITAYWRRRCPGKKSKGRRK